jgi:catechol 2,3-dioxygenase-like lactoylglutathione lyase family enzyme
MIRGLHAMFYSTRAAELRAFFRDKLGFHGNDVGEGWLIFDLTEADLGVHPTDQDGPPSGTADISFYCDDIEATVRDLKARGVEFTQDVEDHGYGLVTFFEAPGDFTIHLYQPRYTKERRVYTPPRARYDMNAEDER